MELRDFLAWEAGFDSPRVCSPKQNVLGPVLALPEEGRVLTFPMPGGVISTGIYHSNALFTGVGLEEVGWGLGNPEMRQQGVCHRCKGQGGCIGTGTYQASIYNMDFHISYTVYQVCVTSN